MQGIFHAQQFFPVALHHLGHRNPGPARYHLGDFFLGYLVAQQHRVLGLGFLGHRQLLFQLGHPAVLQLRHAGKITGSPGGFQIQLRLLEFALDLGGTLHGGLLRLPDFLQVGKLALDLFDFLVQQLDLLEGRCVRILFHRLALYLELNKATFQFVHRLRLGIDFHPDAAGGLVDQVDRLVGQLPVGDVALGQLCRGDDRAVGDVDAVMHLVAFLQSPEDRDGVLLIGLVHQHLLEAALEGGILLHILAVLVESGGANTVQFTAGQGGLEHIARIHGALGLARADHGVQLVDEQDHAALLLGELVEYRFEALLEITAELGAGQQSAQVQRQDALVLQPLGDLAIDDTLRQPLDDGGLADTGLADQHGVVLGAALQYLDSPADLVVATDHRVQLALLRPLGEVDSVLVQGLAGFFSLRVAHRLAATHLLDGALQGQGCDPAAFEQLAGGGLALQHGQQHQFAGNIGIATLLGELVRYIEYLAQVIRQVHLAPRAADRGQRLDG